VLPDTQPATSGLLCVTVQDVPLVPSPRSSTQDSIAVHIRHLRDKLGPDRGLITTVRGIGNRVDGEVVIDSPALPGHATTFNQIWG
jgi:DNA-binding winged helix-turn-helix (wHTH) protein